jgi:hypothetical protein
MINGKVIQLMPGTNVQNAKHETCNGCGDCGIGSETVIICLRCGVLHQIMIHLPRLCQIFS